MRYSSFREIYQTLPTDLKKNLFLLWKAPQRMDKHPEGNTLKHVLIVTKRAIKTGDIDLIMAALFHDLGKYDTLAFKDDGTPTAHGHEKVSKALVSKYRNYIKSMGANPVLVYYLVAQHMRVKTMDQMKVSKQKFLQSNPNFKKLQSFSKIDRGGIDELRRRLKEEKFKLKINIPSDIRQIYDAFRKFNKKLYLVGGAVRDAILKKQPKDFDLATDATPDEVIAIANKMGFSVVELGKQHGVVVINGNEIATFRKDIGKGRRPDSVEFTDMEGDVKRRDLTINALFYDIETGEVIDLVGGRTDLKSKIIRTVGSAQDRFDEDPLRKLRALRFYGQMGKKLDSAIISAIKNDPDISKVSGERIKDEFFKSIVKAKDVRQYLKMASDLGLLIQILPNLKINYNFINENDPIIQVALLLRNNTPIILSKQLRAIKYSGDEADAISFLVSLVQFDPKYIVQFKKSEARTVISKNQIVKFGNYLGINLKRYADFSLTIKFADVPAGISGKDISDWINNQEYKMYTRQ